MGFIVKIMVSILKSLKINMWEDSKVMFGAILNKRTLLKGKNTIGKFANVSNSTIGEYSYVGNYSNLSNADIGKYCSISWDVEIVAGRHPSTYVSTHPVFYSDRKFGKKIYDNFNKTDFTEYRYVNQTQFVKIGNDVLIGANVKLLDGISIGDGAIVLTGAVVVDDVKPYQIVGGVPAKVIKSRFDNDTISKLLDIQWWNKDDSWIECMAGTFSEINMFIEEVANEKKNAGSIA